MAAVPKQRKSHREVRMRRAHWRARMVPATACPQCHEFRLPHRVCPSCGSYNGMTVVEKGDKKK